MSNWSLRKKGSGTNALGNLGKIDGDLRRCDANTDTVEDTASDEGSETIGGNLNCSADQPPKACKHNTRGTSSANMLKFKHGGRNGIPVTSTPLIRDGACDQRTENGSSSQGGTDGTLLDTAGVVKVVNVLFGGDNGCHGGNIESEKHASHGGHHGHEVGVC